MTLEEIARNWTPPASLGYSSLRPVRLARGGIGLLVLLAVIVLIGLVLGAVLAGASRRQSAERDLLREQGVVTDAAVVRVWRTSGKDSTDRVRYRFEVNGREFVSAHAVPRAIWRTLQEGSVIPVRYLPAAPAVNH